MTRESTILAAGTDAAASPKLRRITAVAVFAALTVASARMSIPLPGTPVPFTLQPVAVLVSGLLLGAALGSASQLAYLAMGAVGLPVFALGGGLAYLGGPTGGYLMAFPLAAGLAGLIGASGGAWKIGLGSLAGLAVIHLGGASWLAVQPWLGGGSAGVFRLSFEPFFIGDLLKLGFVIVLTLGLGPRVRRFLSG